jgi:hypothetical protein
LPVHPLHGEMNEAARLHCLIALSGCGEGDFTATAPAEIIARLMSRQDAVVRGGPVAVKG